MTFFLDYSRMYFHLFCQKKVYTACFSCASRPQWLGTNTGSSQGSKGPSYDGNCFFFHNSTRRTCTHKRCRCGNGMVCQSVLMNGLTFSPLHLCFLLPSSKGLPPGVISTSCLVCQRLLWVQVLKRGEKRGGMCYRHRWARHLLSAWQWKNFDCENVSPPQTSTQPWKRKGKTNSRKWGTQIKMPATE